MSNKLRSTASKQGHTSRDRDIGAPLSPSAITKKLSVITTGRAIYGDEMTSSSLVSPITNPKNSNKKINARSTVTNELGPVNVKYGDTTARDIAARIIPSVSPRERIFPSTALTSSNACEDRNLISVPISPMNFESTGVTPSWGLSNGDFGGRGATSIPNPRNKHNKDKTLGSSNSGFLPGLLNPGNIEERIHRPIVVGGESKKLNESSNYGERVKGTSNAAFESLPRTSSAANGSSKLFVSEQASYSVETTVNPKHNSSGKASARSPGYSGPSTMRTDLRTDRSVEVEPWAFKIIEKYHSDDYTRPHSRCSSRTTVHESTRPGPGPGQLQSTNSSHNLSEDRASRNPREKMK